MQKVISKECQQCQTGPDHGVTGKRDLLGGIDGVLLRTTAAVLKGQLDAEPDVNQKQKSQTTTETDDDRSREGVKVMGIGVDAAVEPTKNG